MNQTTAALNLPATVPPEVGAALLSVSPAPAGLSDQKRALRRTQLLSMEKHHDFRKYINEIEWPSISERNHLRELREGEVVRVS